MHFSKRVIPILLITLMSVCSKSIAQSYTGGIRGAVVDPQGSSVTNASVSLTEESTKLSRSAVTNGAGEYVFTAVEPGTYHLSANASGFKKYEQPHVKVDAQQFQTLDVHLTLGAAGEVVEVQAIEDLVNTSNASNGQAIDTQKLEDLPNLGRNPFLFAKLSTNVAAVGDPRFNRFQDQSGSSQISIAGGPVRANNYLVDGVPITDLNNRAVIIPSLEATQEMKLQVNTYDAEIARTGGGVFNTVLKSGTNRLHGGLYGETRQTNWAAHPYFYTAGSPYNATYYNYAGSIGGPVVIPHLYSGRDKTFFWVTEEGYRQRSPLSGKYYVPTSLERAGNFSADGVVGGPTTCTSGVCIKDPLTGQYFAGNIIPTGRINSIGQNMINILPLPNTTPSSSSFESNNYSGTDLLGDRADEFVAKVDHQMFRWWFANASYMHYGSKEPGGNPLGTFAGDESPQSSYLLYRKVDAFTVNSTFTVNPRTIVTGAFGFNRFPNNTLDLSNGYDITKLGFSQGFASSLQKKAFPAVVMQNAATNGTSDSGPAVFYSRSFLVGVSTSIGRHSLKFGYDFRSISVNFTDVTYGNGQLYFDNGYSGTDISNLLLGYPTSNTGSVATTTQFTIATPIALNAKYNAGYFQDDFRVSPRLTVNLGLRYENEPGIHERGNQYAVGFDRFVTNPISNTSGVPTHGGVEFAGQNGYPTTCCNNSNLKFAPRAGIVFSPSPRVTARAGYGVFYAPLYYTSSSALAPGFTATSVYSFAAVPPSNTGNLGNLYPSGLQKPTGNTLGYLTGLGSTLTVIDQYRRSPNVQQYSADIQIALPARMAFQMGYVGAKGRNLQPSTTGTVGINLNQLPDKYLTTMTISQLKASVANPYYGKGGTGVIGSSTVAANQLLRPFPEFSAITALGSSAHSHYDSMTAKLQKSTSAGVSFLTTFTWSSSWDSAFGTSSTINSGPTAAQDIYNLKAEYSRSISDIPLRFTFGGSYDLPFGHGRKFLNSSRWMDLAVGGWSINGVGVKQTGAPLAIQMNSNGVSAIGASVQRPSWAPGASEQTANATGKTESRINHFFNTAAFVSPTPSTATYYAYGNVPRTIGVYGPGLNTWDLSIFKNFQFEAVNLQFRAEALNAFNTPQFGAPNTKIGNSNAGVVTSQVNLPRYIQLGGKISF